MINYSKGRYSIKYTNIALIGGIDEDEYARSGTVRRFRGDGDEFYTLDSVLIGFIRDCIITTPHGEPHYFIASE